jgi:glutamine synthetase
LPEYGPGQFEATISPSEGIRSADQSIILREMAHATAARLNQRVSFSPVVTPESVGNGVHIHFSLLDQRGSPAA